MENEKNVGNVVQATFSISSLTLTYEIPSAC